jgi:alkylation response protein AidB-like acyl-CoA dehydrogenase
MAVRQCEEHPEDARALYGSLFELGIGGMTMPAALGGLDLGLTELAVVHHELGAALAPMLFAQSTVLAAEILAALPGPASEAALPALMDGSAMASCAIAAGPDALLPQLDPEATEPRLKGALADLLVVEARTSTGEPAICLVDRAAAGIAMEDLPNLADLAMSRIAFTQTPVRAVLATGAAAAAALGKARSAMNVAIAAQAVGGAERVLGMTRDYACTRKQFGQPIGGFQAIAHMLASAVVNLEGARYLVFRAAAASEDGEPLETWAAMAKLKACQMFRDVSALAIQVHGGIGFTMEADPQLFFRRAKHLQLMHGEPLDLEEQIGESLISGRHRVLAA